MKRSRAPNFTNAEIMHLLKLVEKYPIIENKRTDGATTKDKQLAWQNLAAEYNSQTSHCPWTSDNLMSCYKNQKIKVKKMHSNEKMAIKAPLLLNAVEEHGQDWDRVAQAIETNSSDCQNTFEQLVKESKREDALYKKEINRTGGGPPPQPSHNSDPVYDKIKTLIGPSLEGLYTIYDGDAEFMQEQNASTSIDTPLKPIEFTSNIEKSVPQVDNDSNPECNDKNKRLHIMKRKPDPSLESSKKGKKLSVSHSFKDLAEDKRNLVNAQKILVESQILHQKLLVQLTEEKLSHEKRKNEMEIEFLQQKYKLELELLKNKIDKN